MNKNKNSICKCYGALEKIVCQHKKESKYKNKNSITFLKNLNYIKIKACLEIIRIYNKKILIMI